MPVHQWVVGGAIIERAGNLLLVQNRRRDRTLDWSPPGGVIEAGEQLVAGLAREVREETGVQVTAWTPAPLYRIDVLAPGMGWQLHVEVWGAVDFTGELTINDPDGIVEQARFVASSEVPQLLAGNHPWVTEPTLAFLTDRWHHAEERTFGFDVDGDHPRRSTVTRRR